MAGLASDWKIWCMCILLVLLLQANVTYAQAAPTTAATSAYAGVHSEKNRTKAPSVGAVSSGSRTTLASAVPIALEHNGTIQQPINSTPLGVEFWLRLLATPGTVYGHVTKAGILPYQQYDLSHVHFRGEQFYKWMYRSMAHVMGVQTSPGNMAQLAQPAGAMQGMPRGPPPQSGPCGAQINHDYKYIILRNRKAAGSAMVAALNKASPLFLQQELVLNSTKRRNNHAIQKLLPDVELARRRDLDAWWRDYFIIGHSRNPWMRAASAYAYLTQLPHWELSTGDPDDPCRRPPSFAQFAQNPMVVGAYKHLFRCCGKHEKRQMATVLKHSKAMRMGNRRCAYWEHDFIHSEPAAHCFRHPSGGFVVDYIVRAEHMAEDLAGAIEAINQRRKPGLPPLMQLRKEDLVMVNLGAAFRPPRAPRPPRPPKPPFQMPPAAAPISAPLVQSQSDRPLDVHDAVADSRNATVRRSLQQDAPGMGLSSALSRIVAHHTGAYMHCGLGCAVAVREVYNDDILMFGFDALARELDALTTAEK